MKPPTILIYATVAFLLFWVLKAPSQAAHVINIIGMALSGLGGGFTDFWRHL